MKNDHFTYPFAINEDGRPVHIDEITNENRHDSHYLCYGCGAELFPVLGKQRAHHFRHEKDSICNPDKYLHEFAKAEIKKRFDENDSFVVQYHAHQKCKKADECEFFEQYHWPECEKEGLYAIDLKQFYDTCSLEKGYYQELPDGTKRYIADLILKHSQKPENKQVCIEIWVTHECTEDKKINGGKIIEIKISKEQDTFREIIECVDDDLPIRFFNFKKKVSIEPSHKFNHIKVIRKENRPEKAKEESICSEGLSFDKNSLFEVIVDSGMNEKEEHELVSVLCNKSNTGVVVDCHLWCKIGHLRTGRNRLGFRAQFLTCGERNCPCSRFQFDEEKGIRTLKKHEGIPYWEKEN